MCVQTACNKALKWKQKACGFSVHLARRYVLNKLFIVVRTKSSKSHKDVRYFEVDLLKLTSGSITFKHYINRKRLQCGS
jgi:hypothetical protein